MRILICPLNWGLGHATRCVPIIKRLMAEGHELAIAADGFPLEFLRQEFPSLHFFELPSYRISYSAGKSQVCAMLRCIPAILGGILDEHRWLMQILKTDHFDQVISDNRFGLWNRNVHSIYMTHQLMIKMPRGLRFMEPVVWFLHRLTINRYKECWIPDEEQDSLSGDLAHKYPLPCHAKFIGTLSRFEGLKDTQPNTTYDTVAVISGIEPQRTIFEDFLIERLRGTEGKVLIVRGQPQRDEMQSHIQNITLISHLDDKALAAILLGAKKIISRSGYSTIMDLKTLNCLHKAELIPTPGQTEQEYLAEIQSV